MRRAACLACFALAFRAVPTLVPKVPEEPAAFTMSSERTDRIQDLLKRGEWARAEAEARAGLAEDVKDTEKDHTTLVAYLAVAEEGLGHHEDAAWHWHEAQAMTGDAHAPSFGAPGEALAKLPVRRLDEAPAGLAVRREGDGGPPLTPARWISGGEAKLSGTRRYPLGIHIQAIVDAEGRVRQPVVTASTSSMLTYAALEAIRGWRFVPAQAEGRPVASFYELKIPPSWSLDRVVALSKGPLTDPLQLLKEGHYAQAEKKVESVWERVRNEALTDQSAGFFGVALLEKALAEAGMGQEDAAICRYQAAQTLEPRLYSASLAAFGAAGSLLMQHPWGSERRSSIRPLTSHHEVPGLGPSLSEALVPHQGEVTRPEILSRRTPEFPRYARRFRISGATIIESVITERGTPRELLLLKPGPTPGLDASVLDAICDWRFKPSTWNEQPIKVYYTLTVNFEVQRR